MAIDSSEYAWRDITITLDGQVVAKATKLVVKTSRETEALTGAGDEAFDINPGNKAHTGELEVFLTTVDKMNKIALAAGYDDLTDIPWILTMTFKATSNAPKRTIVCPNVRFEEFEDGMAQNEKGKKVNMPFKCLKPVRS